MCLKTLSFNLSWWSAHKRGKEEEKEEDVKTRQFDAQEKSLEWTTKTAAFLLSNIVDIRFLRVCFLGSLSTLVCPRLWASIKFGRGRVLFTPCVRVDIPLRSLSHTLTHSHTHTLSFSLMMGPFLRFLTKELFWRERNPSAYIFLWPPHWYYDYCISTYWPLGDVKNWISPHTAAEAYFGRFVYIPLFLTNTNAV